MAVYRVYVEKKPEHAVEAKGLLADIRSFLGIPAVERVRIFNCYDVEDISGELFASCRYSVFAEPQLDDTYDRLPEGGDLTFAYEYLPGQFDQRADSAAQCVQLISMGQRPLVRSSRVIKLYGALTPEDGERIKKYVINPIESREASFEKPATLKTAYELPETVAVLEGFRELDETALAEVIRDYGLAMDLADILCCRDYFRQEKRDPSLTELRLLDTYWSDHCRHTTFGTHLTRVEFEDERAARAFERYQELRRELGVKKPVTLMDIATIGAKALKKQGRLADLDESDEINACTVKLAVDVDGRTEDWLLLFKNETHNHPTEIEPFGGAATCVGGAIRDPLSGRAYVYQAMRLTGAGDPLTPIRQTLPGKLPQRKLVTTAAAGYSSYGNQIGLATGLVDELYHPGYVAKHMEVGMVVGAVPACQVRRETPAPGDVVILLGGRTGRDGCGGATGSSKSHDQSSLESCGAEVQKGNAPEERKLQRLFRDPEASILIKRCNDFGAGGVSVAIGELADGVRIDLDKVPKKYEGLDGTELAISESQERMAVVVEAKDRDRFIELAEGENLEATQVAVVTSEPRLVMFWKGKKIVDIDRAFLDTNGAAKEMAAKVAAPGARGEDPGQPEAVAGKPGAAPGEPGAAAAGLTQRLAALMSDLNICSKRGLVERFDSTIGANTVLMPFGGKEQKTPTQAMAAKLPVPEGQTNTCSVAAYGYNPYISDADPYRGAYLAVVESMAKLAAAGADMSRCWLSFQEYFRRLGADPVNWGKPLAALLGALEAQLDLGAAAIGGKDSMSGSFEELHVPSTLISFAVAAGDAREIISPEFKRAGAEVLYLAPHYGAGLPLAKSQRACFALASDLIRRGQAAAAYTPAAGGLAEAIVKMALGNGLGLSLAPGIGEEELFGQRYGAFVLELADGARAEEIMARWSGEDVEVKRLGRTSAEYALAWRGEKADLAEVEAAYDAKLAKVYPVRPKGQAAGPAVEALSRGAKSWPRPKNPAARPRVIIPVFPGTNCEYDTARKFREAGADPRIVLINNLSAKAVAESVNAMSEEIRKAQIVFLPGGFSGGDEPDGSGKFITAFFRNPRVSDQVAALLDRDGLMGGICNGFQALIKLGLVPYGQIREMDAESATLTYNEIGRHQSRLFRVRVASNLSPWLMYTKPGDIHLTAISHGEGRFVCPASLLEELKAGGQIATQYVDLAGEPSMDIDFNPNGSLLAVEGITSPDGRIFGKMGHSERWSANTFKNVPGRLDNQMFRAAVDYFQK